MTISPGEVPRPRRLDQSWTPAGQALHNAGVYAWAGYTDTRIKTHGRVRVFRWTQCFPGQRPPTAWEREALLKDGAEAVIVIHFSSDGRPMYVVIHSEEELDGERIDFPTTSAFNDFARRYGTVKT